MRRLWPLACLVITAGCLGIGHSAESRSKPSRPVRVEWVKQLYVEDALARLRFDGLQPAVKVANWVVIENADASTNGYWVYDQRPRAGTLMRTGDTVTLLVGESSNGGLGGVGPLGTTPSLIGKPVNEALRLAVFVGLHVTIVLGHQPLPDMRVTKQSLPPGSPVNRGAVINLTVD
jgi:beta-lactam-binding protein with PASTA domain